MSEPIWNQFLTERDKAVFGTSGYGARQGFGKRPALLIIDVNYAFCDERSMPILESIKRWRNSCGEDAWVAMPYLKSLIDKARDKGIPVIYTTGVRREDNWDSGSWSWKNSRSAEDNVHKPQTNIDGNEIVACPVGEEKGGRVAVMFKKIVFTAQNIQISGKLDREWCKKQLVKLQKEGRLAEDPPAKPEKEEGTEAGGGEEKDES